MFSRLKKLLNLSSVFSPEIIFQQKRWESIFMVMQVFLIIFATYKILNFAKKYVRSFGFCESSSIPGIKVNKKMVYLSFLISAYKNSTAAYPILYLALQKLLSLCVRYGKDGLYGFSLIFKPVVIFCKAETIETILSNKELIDKSWEYTLMRPMFGNGLITSQGAEWQKQRKLLTPTFHFSILDECIPIFHEQANILISNIKSRIDEPWIDIEPLSRMCSLDIICETAMGISMNFQSKENSDYINAINNLEEIFMYRAMRPWLYPEIIFNLTKVGKLSKSNTKIINDFNKKVLKQKMEELSAKKSNSTLDSKYSIEKKIRKPFLELLLEHHMKDPSFSEQNILEQVNTFMVAGHDTTATAVTYVLYCLGIYPEVQRQVHEELDAIFEDESEENISREILLKMKYLECVIKETMRLYTVVPFVGRENKKDFKVLDHTVKKGTLCLIFFMALHRDPAVFPDPEKFIPERFLPENCTGRHPYAYVPFSAGPRNCIGQKFSMMEMKTIVACILIQFRIKSLDSKDKVIFFPCITLKNVHPIRLKFELR